jgi:uncharacterized protein YjbI with pentapeptide repeats
LNKEKVKSNVCLIKDCGKLTHKESKYCIFHAGAEEKTETEFKKALKEYVNSIKKEDKNYDFKGFIFIGDIDFNKDFNIKNFKNTKFKKTIFHGITSFDSAIFHGITSFDSAIFHGTITFKEATFFEYLFFTKAAFEGKSSFEKAKFKNHANFNDCIFKDIADFRNATFIGGAAFSNVVFGGFAVFTEITFKGSIFRVMNTTFNNVVAFNGAKLEGIIVFTQSVFKGDINFKIELLGGEVYFMAINTLPGKRFDIFIEKIVTNNKIIDSEYPNNGYIDFQYANLENIFLDLILKKDILINFSNTLLRSTIMKRAQIENNLIQERRREFSEAREIFLILKNNFRSIGKYDDEAWAYKKEKDMDRLSHWFFSVNREIERNNERKKNKTVFETPEIESSSEKKKYSFLKWIFSNHFSKWFFSGVSNIIYGYGEKPCNVIKTAVAIILIFALSFSFIGLGNPEIIELKGTAIHQNSGDIIDLASKGFLKNNVIRNFPDSLYFSTITFTTLGYGDFRPLEGWGRILAGSEAFIGAFMMALFVYTFARRTGGR